MRICIFCSDHERDGDTAVTPIVCAECEHGGFPFNFVRLFENEESESPLDSQVIMASAVIRGEMRL